MGINVQHLDSPSDDGSRAATFVVLASLLVAVAFVFPLKRSWTMSVDENYTRIFVVYDDDDDAGDAWTRPAAVAALGLFGLAAIIGRGGNPMSFRSPLGIVWVSFFAWCALTWPLGDYPRVSLMRMVGDICGILAAFAIAKRSSPLQFVWIVFACTGFWLGLGFLAEVSHGTFRPWEAEHRFAGIFHPNGMGVVCGLLIMSAIYLAHCETRHQKLLYAAAALGFAFLYVTRSRTALISVLLVVALAALVAVPRRRLLLGLTVMTFVAAGIGLLLGSGLLNNADEVVELGRDESEISSMTGRLPLWNSLLPFVAERPWIGHGYGFWSVERDLSEPAQSAHSLYLDLALTFGCVGAALYLLGTLLALARSVQLGLRWPKSGFGFMAMLLTYFLIRGVSETTLGFTQLLGFLTLGTICFLAFRGDLVPSATRQVRIAMRRNPFVYPSSFPATSD
jgi:O-antigen ligase